MSKVIGFICGEDDTDLHLGATDVIIYPTVEALKEARKCWIHCGIVEVKLGEFVEPFIPYSDRQPEDYNET